MIRLQLFDVYVDFVFLKIIEEVFAAIGRQSLLTANVNPVGNGSFPV